MEAPSIPSAQKRRRRWPLWIAGGAAAAAGLALQAAVIAGASQAIQTGSADLQTELTATTVPSLAVTHPDLPESLHLVDRTTGAVVGDVAWPAVEGCEEYIGLPLLVDDQATGQVALCAGP